jgi:hypothetical protein
MAPLSVWRFLRGATGTVENGGHELSVLLGPVR